MKKIFSTCFFFSLICFLTAQNSAIDSLILQLENPKLSSFEKVDLLNQLSTEYTSADISKNDSVLGVALALSKTNNYIEGIINSSNNYGSYFYQIGNYDKALLYSLEAKHVQDSLNTSHGRIRTINNLGRIYDLLEQPDKAVDNYLLSLKLLKKKDKDHPQLPATHFYLGSAYSQLNDYTKAEFHYLQARNFAVNKGSKRRVAIADGSLGRVYTKLKQFKKALYHLESSLTFFKASNQETNQAHTYFNLAETYAGLKDFKTAIEFNFKAIAIYEKQGTNFRQLRYAYSDQSNYYKELENYKESAEFLKKYYDVKDSVFSKEQMKTIEDLKAKYETEKITTAKELAEKQAALAMSKAKQNKLYLLVTLIFLLLSLFSFIWYSKHIKTKRKHEYIAAELKETQKRLALEKQYRASELKALKAQMNPHFVFNALNSIQDYILTNKKELASDYLGKFSDLVRRYLKYSDVLSITLSQEIESLKLYLELEKLRFEEHLEFSICVKDNLDVDHIRIPSMLIQPFAENAIKHGLLHKKTDCRLQIIFSSSEGNYISCMVQDNGIGRVKAKAINKKRYNFHQPFALEATTSRLELLNYKSEAKIGIKTEDLHLNGVPSGTRVTLNIPIQ